MKKVCIKILLFVLALFPSLSFLDAQNLSNSTLEMEIQRYYGIVPLILSVHMEIGKGVAEDESLAKYSIILQDMKYYSDLNVMQYLKSSISVSDSLQVFLNNVSDLLNKSIAIKTQLTNKSSVLIQTKSDCDESKLSSDKKFAQALNDFDSANMEKYIDYSIKYENCSSESRIYYNVYSKIINQIDLYYDTLKNKYDYFSDYKYDIIQSLSVK